MLSAGACPDLRLNKTNPRLGEANRGCQGWIHSFESKGPISALMFGRARDNTGHLTINSSTTSVAVTFFTTSRMWFLI